MKEGQNKRVAVTPRYKALDACGKVENPNGGLGDGAHYAVSHALNKSK